jgi:hypothetical protein
MRIAKACSNLSDQNGPAQICSDAKYHCILGVHIGRKMDKPIAPALLIIDRERTGTLNIA